jgi:hypothetical protein
LYNPYNNSRKPGFSRKQQSSEGASVIATGSSPNRENIMATHESRSAKHEEICSGEYIGDECETIPR